MSNTNDLSNQLKQMEAEKNGVVDINYEKYNNVFMDKVAEHNVQLKREKSRDSDREIERRTEEGAKYLHNKTKGRKIYI